MPSASKNKLNALLLLVFIFFIISGLTSFQFEKAVRPPNVILIVADDLGYSDLASYGNKFIQTPNIDALGKDGVRFTQAYVSAPICGPSREALLTGRYEQRFGDEFMPYDHLDPEFMKHLRSHFSALKKSTPGLRNLKPNFWINRKKFHDGLPAYEITIAQLLKQHGYSTGLSGKWNLGSGDGFYPDQRGYDYSYYFEGALTRYVDDPVDTTRYINRHLPWSFSEPVAWAPRYGSTAILEGRNIVRDTGYLTFSLASKAVDFIDKHKDSSFFLTLTFNAPHDPFQVPKEYFNRVKNVADTTKRVYYGMIEAMDDAVGMVMKKLKDDDIDENTITIFISDNGGATYTRGTTNEPLRGGKCTHFDGGLLVPFFIKYPGVLKEDVYNSPVSSLDIFATIAGVSNAALPKDRVYDGVNLVPYLTHEKDSLPHTVFYWRNGYSKAIRNSDWKLYINEKSKKVYLFDIVHDRGELHDLSKQYPDKVNELQKQLQQWEDSQFIKPRWKSGADVLIDVNGEKIYFPT
jgi:arylsulfatase A-like enzyme